MYVVPTAAGLAVLNHPTANLPKHIIIARSPRNEITRVGLGPELKRAIGRGMDVAIEAMGFWLRFRSLIRLDLNSLEGEPRVMNGEGGTEVATQPT